MTVCAIMQPTWLPYLGYFHLIAQADVFVFLDDVQFARRSWQQRNRILTRQGELMLTVPVKGQDRDAALSAVQVDDAQPWRAKQLNAIRHAYAARPFFAEGFAFVEAQLASPETHLAALNAGLIEAAAANLRLTPKFVRASALSCGGARSDHLLNICRAVGATHYLSPMGSAAYMATDGVFERSEIPVRFQSFVEIPYDQGRTPFVPFMGFIDAVMNLGWEGTAALVQQMQTAANTLNPPP